MISAESRCDAFSRENNVQSLEIESKRRITFEGIFSLSLTDHDESVILCCITEKRQKVGL